MLIKLCLSRYYFFSSQIAVKNNVDVFYFATMVPMQVLFVEDGEMEKRVFLATWKDIPSESEQQFALNQVNLTAGNCCKLVFLPLACLTLQSYLLAYLLIFYLEYLHCILFGCCHFVYLLLCHHILPLRLLYPWGFIW